MKTLSSIFFSTFIILIFSVCSVSAQSTVQRQQFSQEDETSINFFLNCEDCDLTFIRQELAFVSFVRDPLLADVHILVTDSNTSSGGHKYFLNFIGKKDFTGTDNEYIVTTGQSDSDDDIRKTLMKAFKVGILQYYSRTGFIDMLNVSIEEKENKKADEMLTDPWNKWIFSIESAGEFQKEQSQNQYSVTTGGGIQKTTEDWKAALTGSYEMNRENFFDNGIRISKRQNTWELSFRYIKSLTNRWSARIYAESSANTFLNIKHKYAGAGAVEYNIFPWSESNRRVMAIKYNVGLTLSKYIEETIYEKMRETLLSESLEMHLEFVQPWGQVSLGLEGSHLFRDFSKNQLTFESDLSMRLSKNISVFFNLQTEMIHDQLYLPKGDISLEDLLLQRRKFATTYEMSGRLGLRFTFGSIYNNVVNERF